MIYTKIYKMRYEVRGRKYIVSGVPYELVEKEAKAKGLTVDEFIEQYRVVWQYNGAKDIKLSFQPVYNSPKPAKRKKATQVA